MKAYALGIVALAVAVFLRWLLDPLLGDSLPLVTLYGAVAAAVWLGGYRPAILIAIVGYLICHYLFIQPRGHLSFDLGIAVGVVAYLFTCALVIGFGEANRMAHARATERREILRITLQSIGDAVITTDTEGRVTYLNKVAEALTGWSHQDALGQPLENVFHIVNEATGHPVANPAARALREGVVIGLANHTVLIQKSGSKCPIDDSAAPIRDEDGEVSGCVLIFRDVTAQREIERDRASRLLTARLLAAIVESSNDAIVSKSLKGVIQTWNAAAERLFGYTAEQAVGQHISLIIPPERMAEEDHIVSQLKVGRRIEHFETERMRSDGRRLMVSLTISPIKDESGNVVGASKIARDITDRIRAEADRQKFVTLIENSTDFIGMCDLNGTPFFVNRAGLNMVGLDSIEQASQTPVAEFFFPEDRDWILNEFFPGVMENGHGEVEVRFRHFKTGAAHWMAYKVLLLMDPNGKPTGFATVSQDITERKRLTDDLVRLAANLSEADRRKNEFIATLAHELRNPLAPLSNMLEVLKRADDDETRRRARDTMERQLGQMVRLVDDLLDVNRISRDRLELRQSDVQLSSVIQQAIEVARPLIDSAGHDLRVDLPDEPIYLHADPARLAQVFGNLLNNAGRYTRPGGIIWLSVKRLDEEVCVSVKDNGLGIPHDRLESIFDMFTQVGGSPERSQGGLGIGLTLVKRLVEMHGGSVEANSAGEGQGSEFVVRLPVLSEVPEPTTGESIVASEPASSHRILIVDDNRDNAESLALLLGLTGNETYMAHDGIEAVDAVERHRPDVVLLDIGLPKLSGYDVCRRIREQIGGEGIVVIALTGWGQDEDRRKSQEAGFDGHLVKPVDYDELLELLSSLTNGASGHLS